MEEPEIVSEENNDTLLFIGLVFGISIDNDIRIEENVSGH
jgi:hypothetical protein